MRSAKKIHKKKYYRIEFKLGSPLMLGSGENDNSDKDLIKDANGVPYIPASSIAGVVRHTLVDKYKKDDKCFGSVRYEEKTGTEIVESSLIFYDATLKDGENYVITVRDSVALDEYKTAKKSAKFDMEVLEPGVSFVTYVEQSFYNGNDEDMLPHIAQSFLDGSIRFGGKSMRGYGEVSTARPDIKKAEFDLSSEGGVARWLDFEIYNDEGWSLPEDEEFKGIGKYEARRLTISLKQKGGLSIRTYTTDLPKGGKAQPDMKQMTLSDGSPIIPGTSWAGAFRHQMAKLGLSEGEQKKIFGFVSRENNKGEKRRSCIRFDESQLRNGEPKVLSRNAIDRFSGGTVDGALFTEETYYGGETDLVITWEPQKNGHPTDNNYIGILAAAITDLHFGFMAVGGETAIGRGLFEIIEINNEKIPQDSNDVYTFVREKVKEAFRENDA